MILEETLKTTTSTTGYTWLEIGAGLAAIIGFIWSLINSWNVTRIKSVQVDTEQSKDIQSLKIHLKDNQEKIKSLENTIAGYATQGQLKTLKELIEKDYSNTNTLLLKIENQTEQIFKSINNSNIQISEFKLQKEGLEKRLDTLENQFSKLPNLERLTETLSKIESKLYGVN